MSTITSLSKIYPRLDKICDAAFIKKILGTTKKDSINFITENERCRRFFEQKEAEIDQHNEIVRRDIAEFVRSPDIQLEITKYKTIIKEKSAKEKSQKKELEKQAIIEQYLREQEKKKKTEEERAKLGIAPPPEHKVISSNNKISQTGSNLNDAESSSEETVLKLEDFYQLLTAVAEQGHIVFKHGDTVLTNVQIKLDNNLEKIVVQTKPTPMISIKKNLT